MLNVLKRIGRVNKKSKELTEDSATARLGSAEFTASEDLESALLNENDTKIALIQALIPIGLEAVNELLQEEVSRLVGPSYSRDKNKRVSGLVRWGSQGGSVYLSDQKVKIRVPRIRNINTNKEEELPSYKKLRKPHDGDRGLLSKILYGISCRNYQGAAKLIPEVFGLSSSSISRRLTQVSSQKLKEFQERRLEQYDLTAIIVDGKTFASDQMIVALGIDINGVKIPLGFIQTSTENSRVCGELFRRLIDRGLSYEQGLLFVIDGSKGIRKAIKEVFGNYALVQRCQWHKRENVVSYLPKSQQDTMRKKLQKAYEKPVYKEALEEIRKCRQELSVLNQSAVRSLDEGLEETLTLHKLKLFCELGISLKTTNCIESLNSQISRYIKRVTYWKNSNQKHRWLAAALLEIELRLRRIKGYKSLPMLRNALQKELKIKCTNVA